MRQCLTAVLLLSCGALLSGCYAIFIALADATTPEPVQSVDIVSARHPNLCAGMIHREGREAFLLHGDLDARDYEPTSVPRYWGLPARPDDRVHWRGELDISAADKVTKAGSPYVYSDSRPIDLDEIQDLPPIPGTEGEDFANAIKYAWRTSLYRVNGDSTVSRECVFITRSMWFNFAI